MPSQVDTPRQDRSSLRQDQSRRWSSGDRVRVEDYIARDRDLADTPAVLLDLIHGEILLRMERDDVPEIDEYVGRFPALADPLRERWPLFVLGIDPAEAETPFAGVSADPAEAETPPAGKPLRPAGPPPVVPGLEMVRELGRGGMGVVWLARQPGLDRVVAVKILPAHLTGESVNRFRTEAKAIARVQHDRVVRVHFEGEAEGVPYFVMEFMPGGTVSARLRVKPRPTFAELATMAAEAADGLQAVHDAKIIHRDVKPGNLLVAADGRVRVADFGLARILDGDHTMTRPGIPSGTPPYMSPEQARADATLTDATDIWSMGATLYEMLAGQTPFGRDHFEILRGRIIGMEPPAPAALDANVPAGLSAICMRCLRKDPRERYATAADLAADLRRWLAGKTPEAVKLAQRRQWLRATVGVGAAAAAVMAGGWAFDDDEVTKKLKRGEAAVLYDGKGVPRFRWVAGEDIGRSVRSDDRYWTLVNPGLGIVEVLADPQKPEYRVEVMLKHVRGEPEGAVGLYVGGHSLAGPEGPLQSFLLSSFRDLGDEARIYDDVFALMPPPKPPRPELNCLALTGELSGAGGWKELPSNPINHGSLPCFKPHHGVNPVWRNLSIRVSPKGVVAAWHDAGKVHDHGVGVEEMHEKSDRLLPQLNRALLGISPRFNPRGAIGLVFDRATVTVRRIVVIPE